MPRPPLVVVDANMAVHAVVATRLSDAVSAAWTELQGRQARLCAPRLFAYEVTSAIHLYLADGEMEAEEAKLALETALALAVELVDEDADLCLAAFAWASRLERRAAYDGFYLALADRLGAQLWTADHSLCRCARQHGVPWVHGVGEQAQEPER
jgi:predicted nucleic acid-binding protein